MYLKERTKQKLPALACTQKPKLGHCFPLSHTQHTYTHTWTEAPVLMRFFRLNENFAHREDTFVRIFMS